MGRVAEDLDNKEKAELLSMTVMVRGFHSPSHHWGHISRCTKKHYKNPMVFERLYMYVLVRKTNSIRLYKLCKLLMYYLYFIVNTIEEFSL